MEFLAELRLFAQEIAQIDAKNEINYTPVVISFNRDKIK
jgi:hypothetical protein